MIEILAKGEMRLSDLPPIENLHISVPEVKCCKLGCVSSVIDILGKSIGMRGLFRPKHATPNFVTTLPPIMNSTDLIFYTFF